MDKGKHEPTSPAYSTIVWEEIEGGELVIYSLSLSDPLSFIQSSSILNLICFAHSYYFICRRQTSLTSNRSGYC